MTNDYKQLYEEKCLECETLKNTIEVLKQDKTSLDEMVAELQEIADEQTTEAVELQEQQESLEIEKMDLEDSIEKLRSEHSKREASYIEKIQMLNKQIKDFKQERVQLETQVEKLLRNERLITNRADKAEKRLYDAQEEVVMLKSEMEDERDEYEERILRLDRDIKDHKDNNRVLAMQIEKLQRTPSAPPDDPGEEWTADTHHEALFRTGKSTKEKLWNQSFHIPTTDALKQLFQGRLLRVKLDVVEREPSKFMILNRRYDNLWNECLRENVPIQQFDTWILRKVLQKPI